MEATNVAIPKKYGRRFILLAIFIPVYPHTPTIVQNSNELKMFNIKIDESVRITKGEIIDLINFCLLKSTEQTEQFPPHLNIKQLSKYLNYSEAALYKMVSKAEIPHYKISGKILFKKNEIEGWIFEFQQPTIKSRISSLDSGEK